MPRTRLDDDPVRQFGSWWADAEVPMVVATSGPAARAVVLEQFDERGFCFWTSSESPTGEQLARDPRAALVWLWDGRQARVEGRVERVTDEENERHWAEREGKRQLVAFHQSEPVESRDELVALLEAVPQDLEDLDDDARTVMPRSAGPVGGPSAFSSVGVQRGRRFEL